ncbi:MAG: thiamine phosphate synthase [Phyllobacterium sp.]
MSTVSIPNRCRIVLVAPPAPSPDALTALLRKALAGGDVSTVILPAYDLDEARFQAMAEAAVPVIQASGVAALIVNDSRIAGRVKADGLHIEGNAGDIIDAVKAHTPKLIVGGSGIRNRHTALEIGEAQPDYLMFGKLGADQSPEAHPRNLELADWWAAMVEIPCIVQAGSALESLKEVSATGAEFVALGNAVFESEDPEAAIREANRLLDEWAPVFEE